MEHKLSTKFCQYLAHNEIITSEYFDVYVYGMELLLSFLFSTIIILSIGLLTGNLISTVEYLIIFIILRNFTGGYHAPTYLKCKVVSILTYTITMLAAINIAVSIRWYIILGITGCLTIYILAPIENPNKPLTVNECKKHKLTSLLLFILFLFAGLFMNIYNKESDIIFFTLISVIILMIITPHRMKGGSGHEDDLQDHC